jgi:hypothetical protein
MVVPLGTLMAMPSIVTLTSSSAIGLPYWAPTLLEAGLFTTETRDEPHTAAIAGSRAPAI